MIFFRYIVFSILFVNTLFACQLCKLQVPNVHVYVNGYEKDGKEYFDVTWKFEKEFSSEMLLSYDVNGDSMYQADELSEVKNSLEIYLKKYNYLTFLKNINDKQKENIEFSITNTSLDYQYYELVYNFTIKTDVKFEKDDAFEIKFFDEKEFFNFILKELTLKDKSINENLKDSHSMQVYFEDAIKNLPKKQKEKLIEQKEEKGFISFLSSILSQIKDYITNLLTDIKENNSVSSYIWLLVFSFVYGVIHAMGPGHGKALVSSYFISKDGSLLKAFNISMMIGVVHTFSAFILTFSIYYILKSVLSEYFSDVESITIKISALVIIFIGGYLLYKKLKKPKFKAFGVSQGQSFIKLEQQHISSSSCGCSACKTTSTDIGVVLAAGIIPCPGTITIFTFTFGLGIYFVGFLSAIFMSIGMSFIIFIAAYFSIKIKNRVSSNEKIKKILEYFSLVFILSLGIILLFF